MIKRIYFLILAIVALAIVSSAVFAFASLGDFNRKTNERRLDDAISVVKYELAQGNSVDKIGELVEFSFSDGTEHIRITLIKKDGTVIFDSDSDPDNMEDHSDRPEIIAALDEGGTGSAVRKSDTLNVDTFYLAKYDEGSGMVLRAAMPMYIYESQVTGLRSTLIMVFVITAIILMVVSAAAIRVTTDPLIRIKNAANKMAEGDYGVRIPVKKSYDDETSQLIRAFNDMAIKLESVHSQLKYENKRMDVVLNSITSPIIAVNEDLKVTFMNESTKKEFLENIFDDKGFYPMVSVIRSVEAEGIVRKALVEKQDLSGKVSVQSKDGKKIYRVSVSLSDKGKGNNAIVLFQDLTEYEKLQQMRADFVANVTHELKTPLTSIRGFLDTLKHGAADDPAVRDKFLDIIDVEAQRLHVLINDILILSEIEELRADTETETFDIFELIDEVLVLLDEQSSERNISIYVQDHEGDDSGESEGKEPELKINASRNRVKQILINLIENAITYNVDSGKIYVYAYRDKKDEFVLKIRDTGIGIPAEHLPRIFERFYRADRSRSRENGKTGLGLSIVKHIAMLYSGTATAESVVGEGSVFTVKLKV